MSNQLTDAELIEAVAQEVMEFKSNHDTLIPRYPKKHFDGLDHFESFNPLANANHWMMVVEKVCSGVFSAWELNYSLGWFKVLFYISNDEIFERSSDKSIGHAVCLAALEAVRNTLTPADDLCFLC